MHYIRTLPLFPGIHKEEDQENLFSTPLILNNHDYTPSRKPKIKSQIEILKFLGKGNFGEGLFFFFNFVAFIEI
jgi:hypothetical protein